MFIAAEKLHAQQALAFGLVDAVVQDPLAEALRRAAGPGLRHSGR
jgi:enoyl-CoA hydratase/carnithine racemase